MRRYRLGLLLLVLSALQMPHPAASADPGPAITLYRKEVRLSEALRLSLDPLAREFVVDPNVPDVLVAVNLQAAPVGTALRHLVGQVALEVPGLTFSRGGDVYVIRRRENVTPVPAGEAPISLRVRNTPLRDALRRVLEGSGAPVVVHRTIPDVPISLSVKGIPRRSVLNRLVRQVIAKVPNVMVHPYPWRLQKWEPPPPAPDGGGAVDDRLPGGGAGPARPHASQGCRVAPGYDAMTLGDKKRKLTLL